MKKFCAVAMTAALVLTAAGVPAAAEENKIFIGGLVWLDRNGDGKLGDDPGLAGEKAVKITKFDGGELVGEYTTDDKGIYVARDLPAGKYRVSVSSDRYTPTTNRSVVTEGGTVDFGLKGTGIAGRSFFDRNRDGLRQADEDLLSPGTLNGTPMPVSREDGQFSVEDLPFGKYKFVAADYSRRGLALAKPVGGIDWATGTLEVTLGELEGPAPLEALYFEPKGDLALEDTTVSPAKDVYTVGDQIDVKFKLLNKGDVPAKASVVMFGFAPGNAKVLSRSDNVTGTHDDFETVAKILPGESVTVEMKLELTSTEFEEVYPFVRPNVDGFKDVDHKNQG